MALPALNVAAAAAPANLRRRYKESAHASLVVFQVQCYVGKLLSDLFGWLQIQSGAALCLFAQRLHPSRRAPTPVVPLSL